VISTEALPAQQNVTLRSGARRWWTPAAEYEWAYFERQAEATPSPNSNRQGLDQTQGGSDHSLARYEDEP
jgi:hypothetical protein